MLPPDSVPETGQPMTDDEALRAAALALGILSRDQRWERHHAREMGEILGIAMRTVERWASGARSVPGPVWLDIAAKLREHALVINQQADELEARAADHPALDARQDES